MDIAFDERGLAPCVIQDWASGEVLTLAYINQEALDRTRETGELHLWSRSRNELWHKGATSGNTQAVKALRFDCDLDAVLAIVEPAGPACHTGERTCFHNGDLTPMPHEVLPGLERTIAQRAGLADGGDPSALAQAETARYSQAPPPEPIPFTGGAVGFFGYDCVRAVERLPEPNPDPVGLPDMALMLSDVIVAFDHFQIVGASPEPLITVSGRTVSTRPIAGTRPRGATVDDDKAIAAELLADEKERAEHVMLVDLGRNDLGRVCEFGSVAVDELMIVETYSHVMHIVSSVSGTLRDGLGAMDALRASLPAGTLSGAPKIRAMQIIDELESVKRGAYGGAIGYLSYTGDLDTLNYIPSP